MVDLTGADRGNISLPPRLQSPDILDPEFVWDEDASPIVNMQKALYNVRIADTEKRIQRLETRNNELLDEQEEMETLMNSVDVESGDDIAYLKRQISAEDEKIEEIRHKIDDIARRREERRQAHLRNVDSLNEKYENTRFVLTSAIKALSAKINSLEDYKQSSAALREKLRLRDKTISLNEEKIAQKQDEINRKLKIDGERLKKEMYSRLLALAGTFQLEISDTIALPVHRLMRENIFIKAELMRIVDETLIRKNDNGVTRVMTTMHEGSIKASSLDKQKNLTTIKIQRCLLKCLKKWHSTMKKRLESRNMPDEFSQEIYDALALSVRGELAMYETRTRKLEVLLHQESIKLGRMEHMKNQIESQMNICEEMIYDVKYAVACALQMTENGQDILEMSETELFCHLLHLITRGQPKIQCLAVASIESIPRPSDVYARGDLGFEPEHIDLEFSKIEEKLDDEASAETIVMDIPVLSGLLFPTTSLENYELEEARTSLISTEKSSEISHATLTTGTKKSSDYQEISDAADSIVHEIEATFDHESEETEDA